MVSHELCKVTDFAIVDEKLRVSLSELGLSGHQGCSKCDLLYNVCVELYPFLENKAASTTIRLQNHDDWIFMDLESAEGSLVDGWEPAFAYLYYLYKLPPPDWIPLPPCRKPLIRRQDQFQEVLLDWLDGCDKNHPSCQRTERGLPTRVIDVGNDEGDEPFLHISEGKKGSYVALSHCWGEGLSVRTEKSNFSKHQSSIPFNTLPKSFKDAISVVRAINIRYIWIDSLCIVQDDGLDWEIESSKMASIYENAHVVLNASNAANSQDGLWNDLWDDYGQADTFKEFLYTNGDGSISHIVARKTTPHEDTVPEVYLQYEAPSPLSNRAWTLQEELLPWRSVFFSGKELLWKCRSITRCECMHEDLVDYHVESKYSSESNAKSLWESAQSTAITRRFGAWRSLMAYYSRRNITYETDRLPAISGMAKYMQATGAGEYLAGMWKEDLLEALLWQPKPVWRYAMHDNLFSTYLRRASPYRAPTWSWISLETSGDGKDKPKCPAIQDWQENRLGLLQQTYAKVIEANCEPAGADLTGTVKSGYILLKGKCFDAWVTWKNRNSTVSYGRVLLTVYWDLDLEIGLKQKVCCVLFGDRGIDSNEMLLTGLVLRRSKIIAGTFERVGLFRDDSLQGARLKLLKQAKERYVTIT